MMSDPTNETLTDLARKHGLAALVPLAALWLFRELVSWAVADWKAGKLRTETERANAIETLARERIERIRQLEDELSAAREEAEREQNRLCQLNADLESRLQSVLQTSLSDMRTLLAAHEKLRAEHSALLLDVAKQSHIRSTTPTPR